jgi:LysR family transcriptional regulator for bpeEF and oprC
MEDLFSGILPFFHTAEERSFRRAAERLGVTTAAVSKAVAKLEERLDVKLLVRSTRSVNLTPEGARYLEHCRQSIASLRAGRELLAQSRAQPRGEVHLSVSPIVGPLLVSGLPLLLARYPLLSVRLSVHDRLVRLPEEGVDVAVRVGARHDSSLVSRVLLRPRWVTVGSPAYLARHGVPASPEELGSHNAVLFVDPGGRVRPWSFQRADQVAGTPVKGNLRVDNGLELVHAALAGLGLAQVLDFLVVDELRERRLGEVLAAYAAPGPWLHAVTPRERARSPEVQALLAFLVDLFAPAHQGSGRFTPPQDPAEPAE